MSQVSAPGSGPVGSGETDGVDACCLGVFLASNFDFSSDVLTSPSLQPKLSLPVPWGKQDLCAQNLGGHGEWRGSRLLKPTSCRKPSVLRPSGHTGLSQSTGNVGVGLANWEHQGRSRVSLAL